MPSLNPVILYDGVCGFCNQTVQFILSRDKARKFRFAALQSPTAARMLEAHPEVPRDLDSLVLIDGSGAYTQTDAVFRIACGLGLPWCLTGILLLLPRAVRNCAYQAFARKRYAWFGKLESCPMPSAQTRELFLDRGDSSRS